MMWIVRALAVGIGLLLSGSAVVMFAKTVAAFALIALLPGALVLRCVFPQRRVDFTFLLISSGLSTSITVISGLVLHCLNALNPVGWLLWLGFISLSAFWYGARFQMGRVPVFTRIDFKRPALAAVAVSVTLVSFAIVIARQGSFDQRQFAYTELWMLPDDERSFDQIIVGLTNEEQVGTTYDLEILLDGKTVKRWPRFYLKEHETQVLKIPAPFDQDVGKTTLSRSSTQDARKRAQSADPCIRNLQAQKDRPLFARNVDPDPQACDDVAEKPTDIRYDAGQPGHLQPPCKDGQRTPCNRQADSQRLLKTVRSTVADPCGHSTSIVEARPVMIRGDQPLDPCDTDQKLEARLYKNGNLAFLYRNVWLRRPVQEAR